MGGLNGFRININGFDFQFGGGNIPLFPMRQGVR